ncbi:TetR/AcrR family transcriptional regulator [Actinomyces glycerinitolerans]|uniref:Tetr bacterial regulatory protein hth signature n=1 Tax=Actinomyces glycerinitolerans TaxID=1892869 RepID=A0A1M4RZR3_9ACTO|nr:TetR/AcrR family transcriptional regulator [Actinomyces glycerinitolerans]SHE25442.1 tetr bacterial regulatory protein hth signature [Actinomyces glycerinitolerans]
MSVARRQRLRGAERKAQIIDVATDLIGERGYWGISIQDIATRCAITDSAVLHHFGSKESLLLAVLESRDERDRRALADLLGLARSELYDRLPNVSLIDFCDALVQRNASQPAIVALYAVLDAEALNPDHPAHQYFQERERLVIESFARTASDLPLEPLMRGRLALSLMDGLQLRWLRDRSIDLLAQWRLLAKTLLR